MNAKQWSEKQVINGDTYSELNQKAGTFLVSQGYGKATYITQYESGTSEWSYSDYDGSVSIRVLFDNFKPSLRINRI